MSDQKRRIISYIKEHGSITPAEAFVNLGIYNFSARLAELKSEGYAFDMKLEKTVNQYGTIRFGRYTITEEPRAAG